MLGLSKPIPGNSATKVPFRVRTGAVNASIHLCGQHTRARFPRVEFYANGVLSGVVRLEAESMHVHDHGGLAPAGLIFRTASEVVFTKLSDPITPPILRLGNSA